MALAARVLIGRNIGELLLEHVGEVRLRSAARLALTLAILRLLLVLSEVLLAAHQPCCMIAEASLALVLLADLRVHKLLLRAVLDGLLLVLHLGCLLGVSLLLLLALLHQLLRVQFVLRQDVLRQLEGILLRCLRNVSCARVSLLRGRHAAVVVWSLLSHLRLVRLLHRKNGLLVLALNLSLTSRGLLAGLRRRLLLGTPRLLLQEGCRGRVTSESEPLLLLLLQNCGLLLALLKKLVGTAVALRKTEELVLRCTRHAL